MPRVYIALGSNLGRRVANLQRAVALLARNGFRIVRASPVYETRPVGMNNCRLFLNMVVAAETRLSAPECLHRLQAIERLLGRPLRHRRNQPRSIDLDLLLYGRARIQRPELTVPHPRMLSRAFVLVPLADIAPHIVPPAARHQIRTLLGQIDRRGVRRWNGD